MKRFFLLVSVALVVLPAIALAREQVVVILNAEPPAGSKGGGVMKTIRSDLSDMPIRLIVEEIKEFPALFSDQVALARKFAEHHAADKVLWLNGAQGQVFMYFPEPGGERVLARIVEAKTEGERAEAISIIARYFVKAPVDPLPQAPPPPAQPKPEADRLFLRWGYVADFFSSEAPAPHGLFSALSLRINESWSIHLGGRFMETASATRHGQAVTVRRYPFEAGAGYRFNFNPWHVGFAGGVVVEALARSATGEAGAAAVRPEGTQVLEAGYLGVCVARNVSNSSELFMELGSSFFFGGVKFEPGTVTPVAGGPVGGAEPILSTWTIRPMFRAGLNLGIF